VIYATDLEAMEKKIIAAGSESVKPTFEFSGGRRFSFSRSQRARARHLE
jgi:predicted enzyme related to lactoylglutathione lyase